MGTLFSTLDIGRSGLMASQIQLDVAGHNIANVNKEGYSRQRTTLVSRAAQERPYGQLGRGVQVEDIARVREAFLDKVYRQQVPGYNEAETRASYFSRVQDLFQEPLGSIVSPGQFPDRDGGPAMMLRESKQNTKRVVRLH